MVETFSCAICGHDFQTKRHLANHCHRVHKVGAQDYFHKHSEETDVVGICLVCGKHTPFLNLVDGYRETCPGRCTRRYRYPLGRKQPPDAVAKVAMANRTKKRTAAFKKNLSDYWMGHVGYWAGKKRGHYPVEWCNNIRKGLQASEKVRMTAIERARCQQGFPCRGKHEREFMNSLRNVSPYQIVESYECCGYIIDAYLPSLRVAIEFDEAYHLDSCKQQERDWERMCNISNELDCCFIRIEEENWLKHRTKALEFITKQIAEYAHRKPGDTVEFASLLLLPANQLERKGADA